MVCYGSRRTDTYTRVKHVNLPATCLSSVPCHPQRRPHSKKCQICTNIHPYPSSHKCFPSCAIFQLFSIRQCPRARATATTPSKPNIRIIVSLSSHIHLRHKRLNMFCIHFCLRFESEETRIRTHHTHIKWNWCRRTLSWAVVSCVLCVFFSLDSQVNIILSSFLYGKCYDAERTRLPFAIDSYWQSPGTVGSVAFIAGQPKHIWIARSQVFSVDIEQCWWYWRADATKRRARSPKHKLHNIPNRNILFRIINLAGGCTPWGLHQRRTTIFASLSWFSPLMLAT